jgi:hypothetical protein
MAPSTALAGVWKKLHNGSDVRGVAIASAADPATLTEHRTALIAAAFGAWLLRRPGAHARSLLLLLRRRRRWRHFD